MQVAIGLESTDPSILKNSVNKNYDFEDFREAAKLLRENGISVRTYLLLKPPFLTENEALRDRFTVSTEAMGGKWFEIGDKTLVVFR